MSENSKELSNDVEGTGNGGMQLLLLWDLHHVTALSKFVKGHLFPC